MIGFLDVFFVILKVSIELIRGISRTPNKLIFSKRKGSLIPTPRLGIYSKILVTRLRTAC